MKKLAIITSHPIQYNAPLFRLLSERKKIELKVFYTWGQTKDGLVYDPDFKQTIQWDIPLLDGYDHEFVENVSPNPGAGHYKGIMNKDLIERIDRYNPDALLVYGWSFQSHLQVLKHYKGKKQIIFRGDSTLLDESPGFSFKKTARRIFLKWVYRHVDTALYTGEANKQYYLTHGMTQEHLDYAPHAIENERFYDTNGEHEQKAKQWRSELGIPEHAVVFLFAGKLEAKKDPLTLVECFKAMENDHARLIIAGNGILENEVKQKAAGDHRILFLDFQNQQQMPVVYRLGDIFVLPSKGPGETWGLSVNEAMACGLAIIVSDKCGCANELVHGNGFVFRAGDRSELVHTIKKMAESNQKINEMGATGKQLISRFSFLQIAERIESAI